MKKEKLISFFAIGLLVCNIILIVYIFQNHRRPPMSEGPRNLIIERLHLNPDQIKKYDALIEVHKKTIRDENDKMMFLKNKFYSCIIDSSSSQIQDSLKREIGQLQINIEITHYNHFKDIGSLCLPQQMDDFNNLIKEIGQLFDRRMGRPGEQR